MTERMLSKCKQQWLYFCEEFVVWHFATKCAIVKFVKPWMSSHFCESRDLSYIGLVMCAECRREDWRGKACWLHLRDGGPEVVQGQRGVITHPTLLGPVLFSIHSKTMWDCFWPCGVSSPPEAVCPATLPKGKAGMKMKQKMKIWHNNMAQ